MAQVMMSIKEDDGSITALANALKIGKAEVVILGLNVLNYIVDQRKHGRHLTLATGDDKTADILNEATAGGVAFKLNGG